jgi:transcription-repair coupling factor (superfamily II helicase)
VLSGLQRANARLSEVLAAISRDARVDLAGLPPSAFAWVLARTLDKESPPFLVLTPDVESARRLAADIGFFLGEGAPEVDEGVSDGRGAKVLVYPGADVSPYAEVAPDRRATMERLATLFHLAQGLPFRVLVAPAGAVTRRVPPKSALVARSRVVRAEEELQREAFIRVLDEGGYMRVPVVEDPGTYAVRGDLIDVFPPHSRHPARIELDDYLVLSIKLFEPEDQRTVSKVSELFCARCDAGPSRDGAGAGESS